MDLRTQPSEEVPVKEWSLTTHDISGGGVSFLTPQQIVLAGESVEGTLYLETKDGVSRVDFKGKVVYTSKVGSDFHKTAIEFRGHERSLS